MEKRLLLALSLTISLIISQFAVSAAPVDTARAKAVAQTFYCAVTGQQLTRSTQSAIAAKATMAESGLRHNRASAEGTSREIIPFVSTTPTNKKAILEEYTGIHCQYCPSAHSLANDIAELYPGSFLTINIHTGGFAASTYTTEFGTALANQTGLTGYPAGTINRHVFPDLFVSGEESPHSVTDLSRVYWDIAAGRIIAEVSPVNIAARGTLDWSNRLLTITVQLYYTADEANSTNQLNVAILQDNVIGPQTGASTYNPSQMVGNLYRHMHMLRHLITGQWGEEITTTTEGSLVEKTYTYTIPESLGSPNAIEAKLEDLRFIAFVAQGQQEILTGCEVEIEHINMPELNPRLDELSSTNIYDCSGDMTLSTTITNLGSDEISSLILSYNIENEAPMTHIWTGSLPSLSNMTVELPTLSITPNTNQNIAVRIVNANGQDFNGNEVSITVNRTIVSGHNPMVLKIMTDNYASETSFRIYNSSNAVMMQNSSFTNSTEHTFDLNFTSSGCYRLEVSDTYGDGIINGYIQLYDADNSLIFNASGNSFTTKFIAELSIDATSAPEVFTSPVINFTATTATCGGEVTNDGGREITARGICWSITQNPTITGSHTSDGTGTGSFTSNLSNLTPNTTYYVRAYATNSAGTAYGEEVSFTTECNSVIITISGDTEICLGESATIAATGAGSYLWSNNSSTALITVTPSSTTTYSVTGTNQYGCSSTTNVTVEVHELPSVTISGETDICSGESATLTASGTDNYLWDNNESTASITVTPTETTSYTVTGTNQYGCSATTSFIVTAHETVSTEVTVETEVSYTWHDTVYTESGDYTWTGQTIYGCDSTVTLHLTITTGVDEWDGGILSSYPNPTNDIVTLKLTPKACTLAPEIQLFDIYGQRLQVMSVRGERTQIDLSRYATGVYLIKLVNNENVMAVQKVIRK